MTSVDSLLAVVVDSTTSLTVVSLLGVPAEELQSAQVLASDVVEEDNLLSSVDNALLVVVDSKSLTVVCLIELVVDDGTFCTFVSLALVLAKVLAFSLVDELLLVVVDEVTVTTLVSPIAEVVVGDVVPVEDSLVVVVDEGMSSLFVSLMVDDVEEIQSDQLYSETELAATSSTELTIAMVVVEGGAVETVPSPLSVGIEGIAIAASTELVMDDSVTSPSVVSLLAAIDEAPVSIEA